MKFKIGAKLSKQLDEAKAELTVFVDEARDLFDLRSERWRDSDQGTLTEEWLEHLNELVESLENLPNSPEEM